MSRFVVMATWDDAPHLDDKTKEELWNSLPPHQRDARSRGIPQLGSGAIYPVPESEILVKPFDIPIYFPKAYGMDVGWNRTACVWGAMDQSTDILYIYSTYSRGSAEPAIHASAVNSRGDWIPGTVDPASRGRSQVDGMQLLSLYQELGLDLTPADNAVEAGIYNVWTRLSTGRLKIFSHLEEWLAEYRIYRRDDKGRVVKSNDHLMDATRYLVMTGINLATIVPDPDFIDHDRLNEYTGRNSTTGY
jgi:hypothetical protein